MELTESYRLTLEWIHSIGRFGMKPGLERIAALLDLLGNPHRRLKFVHIGGTNGKGSTAAMIASIFQSSGYTVGLFTSPYLLSFTNRMAVNGQDITPAELVDLVEKVRPLVDQISSDDRLGQMTEFEVVTALAMDFFARRRPDLVVCEVGLGGRLDATNVVTPVLSIITNVSLEHTQVLGDTVEAISREKAGIVKPGIPLVTAAADAAALRVIEDTCRKRSAPVYHVSPYPSGSCSADPNTVTYTRSKITPDGQYFSYCGLQRRLEDLFLPLRGAYQVSNAATALAAVELLADLGFPVQEPSLRRGLAATGWHGRLEVLSREPLVIMDGAHNPAAVQQLAAAVPEYFQYRRLALVLGILADKDLSMLDPLLPLADLVILSRPEIDRAADPQEVAAAIAGHFTGKLRVVENVGQALASAMQAAGPEDAVLVTGSLYTVSEARAFWLNPKPR